MAESTAGCMVRGWRWREVLWGEKNVDVFVRYMSFFNCIHNINTWGGLMPIYWFKSLFAICAQLCTVGLQVLLVVMSYPSCTPITWITYPECRLQLLCNCRSFDSKICILQCGNMMFFLKIYKITNYQSNTKHIQNVRIYPSSIRKQFIRTHRK